MEDTKGIYKFYWNCGRQGDLEGVFVATRKEVKEIIGKRVYFGEVLGKHSEVYDNMRQGDITLVTEEPTVLGLFEENELSSGYNPFDYWERNEEE